MEQMPVLLGQMASFAIIMALGYAAARLNILNPAGRHLLSQLVVRILLPCMVFVLVARSATRAELLQGLPILLVSLGMMAFAILVGLLMPYLGRVSGKTKGLYTAVTFCDNSGYVGLPLITAMFGSLPGAMTTYSFYLGVDLCVVWSMGYYFISGGKLALRKILSPVFWAVLAGVLCVLLGVPTQNVVFDSLGLAGDCAKTLAMVYIGSCLTDFKPRQALTNGRVYLFVAVRMILLPLLVHIILARLPFLSHTQMMVLSVISAAPIMMSIPILAKDLDSDTDFALQLTLMSQLLCLGTIPLTFWIMTLM